MVQRVESVHCANPECPWQFCQPGLKRQQDLHKEEAILFPASKSGGNLGL